MVSVGTTGFISTADSETCTDKERPTNTQIQNERERKKRKTSKEIGAINDVAKKQFNKPTQYSRE